MSTPKPQVQNVQSTQSTEPPAFQKPFLERGFREAEKLFEAGPQQFFPGQTFAPTDPATTAALDATEARARAGSPTLAAANAETLRTLSGDNLDITRNPGFRTAVENIRANVLPGIESRFISAGRTGSGLAGRAVGQGLGSAVGDLVFRNFQDERARQAAAVGQAPGLAATDFADPAALGQVGAAREAIAEKPITENIARFDAGQIAPSESLARFLQAVSGNFGGQTVGTTQQLLPQTNPYLTGLGTALGIGSIGARLFSDKRLKTDIKKVGKTDSGEFDIFTYKYKGSPTTHMGVMAQQVAKKKPEAVAVTPSGYLAVDYARL